MYANLEVTIIPRVGILGTPETEFAHEVEMANGKATIHLDDTDDESSYASPAGKRVVDLSKNLLRIEANF